jgi:hypothetical protein
MKRTLLLFGLAAGLFAAGCGDSSGPASGAPAGSGTAVALADSDLPVQADYEEEAEKAITPASYKGELDALEKEIDSAQ